MPDFPQHLSEHLVCLLRRFACSIHAHRIVGAYFVAVGMLTQLAPVSAGHLIAVGVESGRVFVGEIDSQSNHDLLWLRVEKNGIKLMRPISWKSILLAGNGQQTFSPDQLKSMANESNSLDTPTSPQFASSWQTTAVEELPSPFELHSVGRRADAIQAARDANARVAFISLDAYVANWNQTVEADGIVLHVYPTSSHGEIVPVEGNLDVQLIATVPPGWPPGGAFPHIGRWSFRVSHNQFGPNGAVFRLPFQAKHPEFDTSLQPMGLVHARLNVPGNGSFEASQSMVRIRPYSSVRDQLQQNNRRRFFDVERTERFGPR